ncbi:hypothetical protein QIU18_12990 [Capnocytophaga canimorsus]|nr:hypothetical protein [Capnocytophaga canimorsus]WGU70334.1 hypothetical protein QIU18_12990 [Capnocytophaga canimorsus]
MQEKYQFRKEVQFYSLKDTGITDLLNSGIPAVKVQTQARHSDLKVTEHYISRSKFADETIKKSYFYFLMNLKLFFLAIFFVFTGLSS